MYVIKKKYRPLTALAGIKTRKYFRSNQNVCIHITNKILMKRYIIRSIAHVPINMYFIFSLFYHTTGQRTDRKPMCVQHVCVTNEIKI